MPPDATKHRRVHNVLLANNLLGQASTSSPFTLITDSLEQSGKRLVDEFIKNAKSQKTEVVLVAFETVKAAKNPLIKFYLPALPAGNWHQDALKIIQANTSAGIRTLVVIDSLSVLCSNRPQETANLLSSLINPSTSVIALLHKDIPLRRSVNEHAPDPVIMLTYLATTIFKVHSLHHTLERKAARDRSQVEPSFGLDEGELGIMQGVQANTQHAIVLEMEHRRKSGRGVNEWFVLDTTSGSGKTITLLEDYPGYNIWSSESEPEEPAPFSTFELGLTEQQRKDREGVVLPYSDAKTGNNLGGRILYDMGSEDDFDEEEDEI